MPALFFEKRGYFGTLQLRKKSLKYLYIWNQTQSTRWRDEYLFQNVSERDAMCWKHLYRRNWENYLWVAPIRSGDSVIVIWVVVIYCRWCKFCAMCIGMHHSDRTLKGKIFKAIRVEPRDIRPLQCILRCKGFFMLSKKMLPHKGNVSRQWKCSILETV